MIDGDQRFPRWAGPIIGAGLGVVLGLRGMKREGLQNWAYPILGGIAGALAGGVLWLLDAPTGEKRRASVGGSILAVLAIFPGIIPFLGLPLGISAFLINKRAGGWPNSVSRLGLGLCVVLSLVVVVASLIPLP